MTPKGSALDLHPGAFNASRTLVVGKSFQWLIDLLPGTVQHQHIVQQVLISRTLAASNANIFHIISVIFAFDLLAIITFVLSLFLSAPAALTGTLGMGPSLVFLTEVFLLIDNLLTIACQCSIGFALASLVFTLVFLWLLSWLLSLALRVLGLPFVACQKFFLKIDDTMTIFHWLHVSFSGLLSFSSRSHTTSSFRINLQALRGEWQSLIWV